MIATIIGGMIAAGTGWFLNWRTDNARIRLARSLLAIGICDDLEHSESLYERIGDDWERTKGIWFATMNELRESQQAYLNQRDSAVFFDDADLRKRLFRYYLRSGELINQLEFCQRRKNEIQREFDSLAQTILARGEIQTWEEARKTALLQMQQEDAEYTNLDGLLLDGIAKIPRFSKEAKELLEKMKSLF